MDKMEAHLRQQLSAMMDGELASDEARFLFRRLQHDRELAGCWERWQVCSVVLRGQGEALLPADFSQRVARALAEDAARTVVVDGPAIAATGTHSRRWAWWGGGAALAASLALLVVVPRPASGPARHRCARGDDPGRDPAHDPIAAARGLPDASRSPSTPPGAAVGLATALAIADARRAAARRNRVATPDAGRAPPPAVVEAATEGQRIAAADPQPSLELPRHANPFSPQEPASRPWPRAVLPGSAGGAFTASYSTGSTASFYSVRTGQPCRCPRRRPRPATAVPEPRTAGGAEAAGRPIPRTLPTFVPSEVDSRCPYLPSARLPWSPPRRPPPRWS
ncbi:MAG: RseA family anti-sigma factor [Lysobacterales bacterium]